MDPVANTAVSAPEIWLDAAYESLVEGGVDSVRIRSLAKQLGRSRTSFYWVFKDRDALLTALPGRWKSRNTRRWIERTEAHAQSICEAVLNVIDCWFDDALFDSRYEAAVRSWAHQSPAVASEMAADDARRVAALRGYASARSAESLSLRASRIAGYVEVFTAMRPEQGELDRFLARTLPKP